MGKRGGKGFQKKEVKNLTTTSRRDRHAFSTEDMDDEIDAFHKQRDVVPLDINADGRESESDDEIPIFDSKDIDESDDDDDEEDDSNEDDYDDDDNGEIAKIIRQKKYLEAMLGGEDDGMQDDDDDEDDEEDHKPTIGGRQFSHGADNRNFEIQSSDDEAPKEEEEIALQLQREKAQSLTMEDYDLVDIIADKDSEKLTFKDATDKGNREIKSLDRDVTFKVEDLNALSKEEQMKVLYRSAPELIDWLSELNEAHKQLECKINPLLSKVKSGEIVMEGGVRYFELKQLLLLSYCQAITFCLLLKSEGQPVYDHPVMTHLEEIKELKNQIKQLDAKLPIELEDILKASSGLETVVKSDNENVQMAADSITKNQEQTLVSAEPPEEEVPSNVVEIQKSVVSKDGIQKRRKEKDQNHIGMQSLEMLKIRASLEEKLRQQGLYSQIAPKPSNSLKRSRPANGQLATYDDFDDDAVDVKGPAGQSKGLSSKISQFVNANYLKKPKVVSGDEDLPKRDSIRAQRKKNEDRVLNGAGIKTEGDDNDDQMGDLGSHEVDEEEDIGSGEDSGNEFYEQAEKLRAAKLAAKAGTYSTSSSKSAVPSGTEETVDGKRLITPQISKNRGLTRSRNKAKKNPRKNYKLKHQKAVKNRKGQVQSIRKPTAPYGGESTGINANISRSVRFKN
ncbi:protein THALLO isoform X2 [Cicer arietinum]|uniref:Something about silencing protein 10 isoform X2 n=1 Tax=Cicer arietinum TaxID=3827 RepID=A0A1S3E9U4_CICAR|nr:something about silencing protein 10 isoform X2 [Cicer arietinum]